MMEAEVEWCALQMQQGDGPQGMQAAPGGWKDVETDSPINLQNQNQPEPM